MRTPKINYGHPLQPLFHKRQPTSMTWLAMTDQSLGGRSDTTHVMKRNVCFPPTLYETVCIVLVLNAQLFTGITLCTSGLVCDKSHHISKFPQHSQFPTRISSLDSQSAPQLSIFERTAPPSPAPLSQHSSFCLPKSVQVVRLSQHLCLSLPSSLLEEPKTLQFTVVLKVDGICERPFFGHS